MLSFNGDKKMNVISFFKRSFFSEQKSQKSHCFALSSKVNCGLRLAFFKGHSISFKPVFSFQSVGRGCEALTKNIRFLCFLCVLFSPFAHAVKIYFPDEELATESVLPHVDKSAMVLNKNINLKWRVEFNTSLGVGLDEPFYFKFYPMGQLLLHVSDFHAVGLLGIYYPPLLSSAGKKLQTGVGLKNKIFDATKAPYPQMSAFLTYQYSPFYGKISLSKVLNLNLSIYGFTGLGFVVSNQNDRFLAANIGFGQKLYISKWLGLRGDLAFYGYYGPATAKLDLGSSVQSVKYSAIQPDQKRVNLNILASIGVIFLL